MEEVLLGSASNTVSLSSSGCSSGEKRGRSQNGGICPLLSPSPHQEEPDPVPGTIAPLNSTDVFSQTCSPAEARGTERCLGCRVTLQNALFPRATTGGESRLGLGFKDDPALSLGNAFISISLLPSQNFPLYLECILNHNGLGPLPPSFSRGDIRTT